MPWGEQSGRTSPLPPNWAALRRVVLQRDGHRCLWAPDGRAVSTAYYCDQTATDVDHIGDPTDHGMANLRSMCGDHHAQRTSAQGNAARWRYSRKRRPERHPGILD